MADERTDPGYEEQEVPEDVEDVAEEDTDEEDTDQEETDYREDTDYSDDGHDDASQDGGPYEEPAPELGQLHRDYVLPGVAPGEDNPYRWHTGEKRDHGGE